MSILLSMSPHLCIVALAFGAVFATSDINENSESDTFNNSLSTLARQLMLQQLYMEENARSEGDSGLKLTRLRQIGPKSYFAESHSSPGMVASIHDHANNIRTIGLGEFIAVLNGVEFRTRHNDYHLYRPSTTSTGYHETEDIPFPDVPPEVLQHTDVDNQIDEMREWFRAFKDQNTTHRDYRPYFKPVLCYLEGAWTSTDVLQESFESDRHFLDAESWHDLQEKIRFTSYTGRKDPTENYAYLPTTIMDIINGSVPVLAQWNYRIMCHPLQRDVPLNRLQVVNDLSARMASRSSKERYLRSRAARFRLNPEDSDVWPEPSRTPYEFLDSLMGEVPGKDNYPANITDDAFLDGLAFSYAGDKNQPLNVGYYHRAFRSEFIDAMGRDYRRRGYNDQNVFMAATTNLQVAPMTANVCHKNGICHTVTERWTYAIPLELIYLTPLSAWNPYNIEYKGDADSPSGRTVRAKGRTGKLYHKHAYNGTNSRAFFMTPHKFFFGEINLDAADTNGKVRGVLDRSGEVRLMKSTGLQVILRIRGVGIIRQRYPIMPIYGEGSTIYKELEALKDLVLERHKHEYMFQ